MEYLMAEYPYFEWSLLAPAAYLLLRILLAVMFIDSGRRHLTDPKGRAAGLGLPPNLVVLVGLGNVIGGSLVLLGLLTELGAAMMIVIMLGAIYFKVSVWKTGLYGENNGGWYYDALLLAGAAILLVSGAGTFSLDHFLLN